MKFIRKAKKIALMVLVCSFAFVVAACGKKGPTVEFYACGDNTLAVLIQGEDCAKLIPEAGKDKAQYEMELEAADFSQNIHFTSTTASFWHNLEGDESESFYAWDTFKITENSYFATFYGDGAGHLLDNIDEAELTLTETSTWTETPLTKINPSKKVTKIDESELAKLAGEWLGREELKVNWEGQYATSNFFSHETEGTAEVKVLPGNIVFITTDLFGEKKEFVLVEREVQEYDDGMNMSETSVLNAGGSDIYYSIVFVEYIDGDGNKQERIRFSTVYDDTNERVDNIVVKSK